MPELPDLYVFSGNLLKLSKGKPITAADVHNIRKVNAPSGAFAQGVAHSDIVDIVQQGKELYFHLSNGNVFSVHLMLNGKFQATTAEGLGGIPHKIISLTFADNSTLAVSDYHSLCKVTLHPAKSHVPDALSARFDYGYFAGVVQRNATTNVKGFLIDQKIVRGIGNAYADEILYKANISPESVVGKIPEDALHDLYDAIGYVLKDAIANIQRLAPDSISGEERSFLKVHNFKKKTTDDGEPIIVKEIATKRTYFTKKQRLFL